MKKIYNAKLVPMGIGGYDIDFIIKDPNTGEISIATHIATHLTTIKGIEYEAQRLIILNEHSTHIASYPNMPDTHCIDLADVRKWIDNGCSESVELSVIDEPEVGYPGMVTNYVPAITNNTVKMVWGESNTTELERKPHPINWDALEIKFYEWWQFDEGDAIFNWFKNNVK